MPEPMIVTTDIISVPFAFLVIGIIIAQTLPKVNDAADFDADYENFSEKALQHENKH